MAGGGSMLCYLMSAPHASSLLPPGLGLTSPGGQSGQDHHSCSLRDPEVGRRRRLCDSLLSRPPGLDPLRLAGPGGGEVLPAEAGGGQ